MIENKYSRMIWHLSNRADPKAEGGLGLAEVLDYIGVKH